LYNSWLYLLLHVPFSSTDPKIYIKVLLSFIHSFICMSKILYMFWGTGYRLLSIISIKYMSISIIKHIKNMSLLQ
jgi:hypothetical protein